MPYSIFCAGALGCLTPPNVFSRLSWSLDEPDLMQIRARGTKTLQATCELVGADSLRIRYQSTGEVLTGRVWDSEGSWNLTIPLPNAALSQS